MCMHCDFQGSQSQMIRIYCAGEQAHAAGALGTGIWQALAQDGPEWGAAWCCSLWIPSVFSKAPLGAQHSPLWLGCVTGQGRLRAAACVPEALTASPSPSPGLRSLTPSRVGRRPQWWTPSA